MPSLVAELSREQVPDRAQLLALIRAAGFRRLDIDPAWQPFAPPAYVPCTLEGEDAGFDLRFDTPDGAPVGTRHDTRITLRWSGDPREEAAATIVCAVLAAGAGARVHTGLPAQARSAEQLAARARSLVQAL